MYDVKSSTKLENQEIFAGRRLETGLNDQPHAEECNQADSTSQNLEIYKNNEQIRLLQDELAKARSQAGEAFNENEQWQKWAGYMEARIKEYEEANQSWEDEAFHNSILNKLNISSDDLINQHIYSFRSTIRLWLKGALTSLKYVFISILFGGTAGLSLGVVFYLCQGAERKLANPTVLYSAFSIIGVIGCGILVLIKLVKQGIYPSFKENKRKYIAIEEFKRVSQRYYYEKQLKKQGEEYSKWQMQKKIEAGKKEFWQKLSGEAFENELKNMLRLIGYRNFNSYGHPNRPDGGVDFYAVDPLGKSCVIQCKAHKKRVSESHVRDLLGVLAASEGKATYAVMASLGGLTKPAQKFADRNGIHVWSMEEVVKMSAQASSKKGKVPE